MRDEHVMETLGMARVVISDGKIVSISEPKLDYCPLFHKHRGIERITKEIIRGNIKKRISEYGLFTEKRNLEQNVFVGFGTSEIFMSALKRGKIDAVICVCEGAGTVITGNAVLAQGIGARLSGLVSTTPIRGIIDRIEDMGGAVLDSATARIDQYSGLIKASQMGFDRVGITLVDPGEAKRCKAFMGDDAVTFLVHTSGICPNDGNLDHCDLVTSCASKWIRENLGNKIKAQAGSSIPIFALSEIGKELLLDRAKDIDRQIYISTKNLPNLEGVQPRELF